MRASFRWSVIAIVALTPATAAAQISTWCSNEETRHTASACSWVAPWAST